MEQIFTSIFLPSTMVPWRPFLAFSASSLVSNVMKPKPFNLKQKRLVKTQEENYIQLTYFRTSFVEYNFDVCNISVFLKINNVIL